MSQVLDLERAEKIEFHTKDERVINAKRKTKSGKNRVLDCFLQSIEAEGGETFYVLRIDKSTPGGVFFERKEIFAIT